MEGRGKKKKTNSGKMDTTGISVTCRLYFKVVYMHIRNEAYIYEFLVVAFLQVHQNCGLVQLTENKHTENGEYREHIDTL